MHLDNPAVYVTLLAVAIAGVLMLAAHQLEESGHRRWGITLLIIASSAAAVGIIGPHELAELLFVVVLYLLALGVPAAAVVLVVRGRRRRRNS